MTRVLYRPRVDEADLSDLPDPVAKPISFDDIASRVGIDAPLDRRHLNHALVVEVLAELRAEDAPPTPAEQIRHALTMAVAPLAALLAEPLPPVTNWQYYVENLEAKEINSCLAWRETSIRHLDAVYNDDVRWWYTATGTVIHPARELQDALVADMAASILAEVAV